MFTLTTHKNLKRRLGESSTVRASKVQRIMSTLPDRMRPVVSPTALQEEKPDTTVTNILKDHQQQQEQQPANNAKIDTPNSSAEATEAAAVLSKVVENYPSYSDLQGFFQAPTQVEIDAYQHDILTAVRNQDVDTLRRFHAEGRPMKCSNEFGESILHLACRKGLTKVAHFLIEEAKVTVEVCDDYGRNCMHDAAWVHTPNFELIDLVLSRCPDLLFIKDRRGHTPLSFARRDQWKCWNDYLKTKTPDFLMPQRILGMTPTNSSATLVSNDGCDAQPESPAVALNTSTFVGGPATQALAALKRPSVAKTGIQTPTLLIPKVAASGIKIAVPQPAALLAPPAVVQTTTFTAGMNGLLLQAAVTSTAAPSALGKQQQEMIIQPNTPATIVG